MSDAERQRLVQQHSQLLSACPWLGPARSWWPRYLFHTTDLLNAVEALRAGELLSRNLARGRGLLKTESASQEVLGMTEDRWKDYVRFYFRPRTPFTYANEGVRPPFALRFGGAHQPVPICFVFAIERVLSDSTSLVTPVGLYRQGEVTSDLSCLAQFPWQTIYHVGGFAPDERDHVVQHRHAEALVKDRVDLGHAVALIACRSAAEHQTLLATLTPAEVAAWGARIAYSPKLNLFHGRWSYVEEVTASRARLSFRFNTGSLTPGPFLARVDIGSQGMPFVWQSAAYTTSLQPLDLSLDKLPNPGAYSYTLTLDGHIACTGRYDENQLPF